jgi:glycine/D-amino acid oxidase-like deaminating enzyme
VRRTWAARLLADLKLPLSVARQTLGFYRPLQRELFELGRFPLFLIEEDGHNFYGFPFFGVDCLKVAHHHGGEIVTPENVNRAFNEGDDKQLRDFLARRIPQGNGRLELGKICLYTNTPDFDFILDIHPQYKNISIAAGFSGHGFKFASAVGEVMADLATTGTSRHAIARFKLARFNL